MKRAAWLPLIALLLLLVPLGACNPEDDQDDITLDEAIAKGKQALELNDGVRAARYFRYVQSEDTYNTQAAYGLILANWVSMMNLVDTLLPVLDVFSGDAVAPAYANYSVGDALQSILDGSAGKDFADSEAAFAVIEPARPLHFELGRYRWILGDSTLMDVGGDFDRADLYVFGSLDSLILAFLDIADAHNLDMNLGRLAIPTLDLTGDPAGTIQALADLLSALLTDPYFSDFLVMEDDGAPSMADAGVRLGDMCDRFYRFFNELTNESADQDGEVFKFIDVNESGRFELGEDAVKMGDVTLSPETAEALRDLCANLRLAFWEGSPSDPNPFHEDKLTLGMLNGVLVALGVLDEPVLPDWIGFNIGQFFTDPNPTALRGFLETLVTIMDDIAEAAAN